MQQHPGQHLSDLVVQVAGDADPFGLLRGEHAPAALLALALEPVEHAVEGRDDAADLIVGCDRQAAGRGRKRSTVSIRRASCPSGATARLRSSAFAASVIARPTTMISACSC